MKRLVIVAWYPVIVAVVIPSGCTPHGAYSSSLIRRSV
ncbi:hypothetical protein BDK63_000169 [Halomonas campaniensis]|uniref:Uncharacterized protein n=1 Tax=Halomonas campaniensis TaxID=213554 RepID=A0A7W5P971_9GAMM|nr:hypothetical protein [Halomonas campaniensis]